MLSSLFPRQAAVALTTLLAAASSVNAQTWSDCNPMTTTCEPKSALGRAVNVDFTQGSVNSFGANGEVTYNDEGASFTVAKGGDAPQLNSVFYIMFGRVEIHMRAAPGAGIVSSLVLQSDNLDEIDIEWLGSNPNEIQSNYFGKGNVATYNRGQFHPVPQGTQDGYVKYTVDWTKDRIIWTVDDTVVRELPASEAEPNQYPQTPMQIRFGAWAGGDPNYNSPGTVEWSRGPTDYSQGPFSMHVRAIAVTDYSTGSAYRYTDQSGSWESIEAIDGEINGNIDAAGDVRITATAEPPTRTEDPAVPTGIGRPRNNDETPPPQTGWPYDNTDSAPTSGAIPDGWVLTPQGKIVPDRNNAGALVKPGGGSLFVAAVPFLLGTMAFFVRL